MGKVSDRRPCARASENLTVEPVADELLVFEPRSRRAHRLNRAAALVFLRCDGRSTVDEIADALRAAGLPASREVVELAVAELAQAGLVEPALDWSRVRFRSRRTLLKQLGLLTGAALALPIVQSIVAPSVAAAASCGAFNHQCGAGFPPCCPGFTCTQVGMRTRCR
jgi:hypothetical protein